MSTATKRERDTVLAAIDAAIKATERARREALNDTRTSGMIDPTLGTALIYLRDARSNMLLVAAGERPFQPPKQKAPAKRICHVCDAEIADGDLSVCGGCNGDTCPDCMGEGGEVCVECEGEDE